MKFYEKDANLANFQSKVALGKLIPNTLILLLHDF